MALKKGSWPIYHMRITVGQGARPHPLGSASDDLSHVTELALHPRTVTAAARGSPGYLSFRPFSLMGLEVQGSYSQAINIHSYKPFIGP